MSGVEIVGFVLGGFPLLISAAEHYKEGFEPLVRLYDSNPSNQEDLMLMLLYRSNGNVFVPTLSDLSMPLISKSNYSIKC